MPSWPHAAAAPHPLLRFMPKYAAGSVAMTTPRLSMLRRWQRYRDRGGGCRRLAALLVQGAAAGGRAPDSTCTPYTQHPAHAAAAPPPPPDEQVDAQHSVALVVQLHVPHRARLLNVLQHFLHHALQQGQQGAGGSRGQAAAGGAKRWGREPWAAAHRFNCSTKLRPFLCPTRPHLQSPTALPPHCPPTPLTKMPCSLNS